MSELDEIRTSVANIRLAKREYRALDFKDVEKYCFAKRDEALTIFLEMEDFIQKNLDIFYTTKDNWTKRREENSNYGMKNEHNRVHVYFASDYKQYVWIDNGIMFIVNAGKVVYISKMEERLAPKENTAFDNHKFNYFCEWVDGRHPEEGYSRYSFYPRIENYFSCATPATFVQWSNLKRKVDEDYENAVECRKLLAQAVKEIQEDEQKYLDGIRALKESSKAA